MIEVEAAVRYWTPNGMRPEPGPGNATAYVERSEVERLLTLADHNGYQRALQHAKDGRLVT